jgi:hydrogenase-4 component B
MMVYEGSGLIGLLFKVAAIILFTGLFALIFVPFRFKPFLSIVSVFLIALITGFLAIKCFTLGDLEFVINGGTFFGEIPLRIDTLSAWFILIINITSVTGVIYGAGYLKSTGVQSSLVTFHWMLYIVFHSSMILVTIVQHSVAFIVIWEIMSLSSFLLILFDYTNQKVLKAGINYLVQMHLSIMLITVAFIWVYFKTGTFDFKGISVFFGSNCNIWLFLIFFAGFGIKAGFLGLHTWLPQAHPAAPSHISGVMSGVIVKMGIYGIFRIITCLKSDYLLLGEIIISLSILTGLFGIMNAAVQRDFKKMLAYCTIENIGIIGIGIGIGLFGIGKGQGLLIFFGFGGALLHVLNHSLFKSLLFFSAGSVYSQTHTRGMDNLGGLIKKMPTTGIIFLVGSVAIGGMPPLNGFISEFLIYCGILKGINSPGVAQITLMIITLAGMSLIGGISILAFTKAFGTIFLGTPRRKLKHDPVEVSSLMLIPQYIIIGFMIFIALFPGFFVNMTGHILSNVKISGFDLNIIDLKLYLGVLKNISIASVIFIMMSITLFIVRWIMTREAEKKYTSTWGCGYLAPNERMQYTGKSFSKSFGKILNFMLIEKKGYTEIERSEIFPGTRKYRSFYLDIIESKIIDPLLQLILRFINHFQFIQNGKIQAYVIYGIIFILAIFIGTVLNIWH